MKEECVCLFYIFESEYCFIVLWKYYLKDNGVKFQLKWQKQICFFCQWFLTQLWVVSYWDLLAVYNFYKQNDLFLYYFKASIFFLSYIYEIWVA